MNTKNTIKTEIYVSWLLLASFYLYQYILRSSTGVLIDDMRRNFNMNADLFSLMGSMYYYGYSLMQVPLGIIIDKNGIRNTALLSISLCILGTLLTTIVESAYMACFCRFIVGVGAASAFMSGLKLANEYFPPQKKGIAMGVILSFGAAGALITGAPLNFIIHHLSSWKNAFVVFAMMGCIILILAFLFLPKNKKNSPQDKKKSGNLKKDLLSIIRNKKIIMYSIVTIGLFIPLSVMADLWGTAFLIKKFNLSREAASPILMNIYIGMALGSVILPYLTIKYRTETVIKFSCLFLFSLFSLIVYIENINYTGLTILLVLIGFFCGAEMLCFKAVLSYVKPESSGLTIGIVNTLNMLAGALMQQIIGNYLDFTWSGGIDDHGLRLYTRSDFIEAFSILVAIIAICTIVAFLTLNNKRDASKLYNE